jgi:hypothetical protein
MVRVGQVLLAAVVATLPASAREPASLVQGTSGAKAGMVEVHAGGLVLRQGSAGSAFGTVRKGKGKLGLSYFVLLRSNYNADSSVDSSEEVQAETNKASSKQVVGVDGSKLTIAYAVEIDRRTKAVLRETLTVNGTSVDLARGRVLLVDLRGGTPKWQQKNLTLPAEVPDTGDKKATLALAQKVSASLVRQDKSVRAFVAAAGR